VAIYTAFNSAWFVGLCVGPLLLSPITEVALRPAYSCTSDPLSYFPKLNHLIIQAKGLLFACFVLAGLLVVSTGLGVNCIPLTALHRAATA
jgi:hypothetical protein